MSAATIHDLLGSLEQTIHDRFRLITQLLTSKSVEPDNSVMNALIARIQSLERRLDAIPPARQELLPRSPMVGLEVSDKAVAAAPEKTTSDKLVTVNVPVSDQAATLDEVVGEAADDLSVIITAEAEVNLAMDSAGEEEAEEEAEEEEAEELTEFEYKGATYYRDSDNNVFTTDEDGELEEEPFGLWNELKQRIVARR